MTTSAEIQKLIQSGENETLEFKSSFNDEVIESIVAFANSSGGSVLVGVSNAGKITGTTTGNETLQNWANEIKNKTIPAQVVDITDYEVEGKSVCQIRVNEYPVKPVSFKGRYFKRVKNSNHQLNVREISEIHLQSLQLSWDAYPYPKATLDDLDYHKIRQFVAKVNNSGRFILPEKVEDALSKLRMVVDNVPVNAAMLLFAKEPLNHNVHVGRFKTPSMIIDDKIYKGGLFEVVEETMRYIIGQIKVAFEITGKTTQRTEIFEYPIPALRELVLNAIIHRDYTSPVDIQIKIFDQSITFFNPGRLYGNLTIEELKTDSYQSRTRNKLIAEAFYLTKDIEKYGSGYIRIRREIKEYPTMKFEYRELGDGFLVEIKYEKQKLSSRTEADVVDGVVDSVVDSVVDIRLNKIIELIKSDTDVSASQIAEALNISSRTVQRDIDKLKKQKRIIRVGPEKGGHWEIIQK